MPARWYQVVDVDGDDILFDNRRRQHSKFWNEGKWNNFIKPLLPEERNTFLEIGCNAGLFLKMAVDEGFKDVIGVEGHRKIIDQAKRFKESNKYTYKLIHQKVGVNFELDQLRLLDVVLISNVHYHIGVPEFSRLIDDLRNRCLYCIVVSARVKRRAGRAFWDKKSIKGYFRDWEEVGFIDGVDAENDLSPRPQMYGILFKGNLSVIDVNEAYDRWAKTTKSERHRSYGLALALEEFFGKVFSGEIIDYESTLLYKYWEERNSNKSVRSGLKRLAYKESLAKDIQENGMKTPVHYVFIHGRIHFRDGLHRLCIAKALGHKHILGRLV